jgi:predicted ATPase
MDNYSNQFRETALNPQLLSSSFKITTNWHVITGAPCSGKTTLLDMLADMGFKTVHEAGRTYVVGELAKGLSLEVIRKDQAEFTRQIYSRMLSNEHELHPDEVCFLDRAIPDGPAFYRYAGMNPNDVLPDCFQYQYASVFVLDRLPYVRDGVRDSDDPAAEYLDTWIERDYASLGYDVMRVPVLPPVERLDFILERLPEMKEGDWRAGNG